MRVATQRPIVIAHAVPMEKGEDIVYKWSGNKEIGEDMVYKWSGNKEMGESWNRYHFKGWVKKGKKGMDQSISVSHVTTLALRQLEVCAFTLSANSE